MGGLGRFDTFEILIWSESSQHPNIRTYTLSLVLVDAMSPTVQELRNKIRIATGRFEREFVAQFTKEELAAIANAVGHEVTGKPLPPKPAMRAAIRRRLGMTDDDGDAEDRSFRKGELETIADSLESADR